MNSQRIRDDNHSVELGGGAGSAIVRGKFYNELKADFDANFSDNGAATLDTITEKSSGVGVTIEGIQLIDDGISPTANVVEKTVLTTLTAAEIVGTAAGDVGHVDGAILVAALGSDYTLEFVSALFIYDYDTAAYTGGADDIVVQLGASSTQLTVSGAITGANLLEASGDKLLRLGSIDTELANTVGTAISIAGTALTQPGTAAGVLRVYTTYRIYTTGL